MEKSEKKGCNLTNIEWHDEWHYGIAQQHPESKISKVQHAGNKNMIKWCFYVSVQQNAQTFGQSMWEMTCSCSQSLVLIQLYSVWAIRLSRMDGNSSVRIWTTDKDSLTETLNCICCQMWYCFVLCGKNSQLKTAEICGWSLSLKLLIWRHVKHWSMCRTSNCNRDEWKC